MKTAEGISQRRFFYKVNLVSENSHQFFSYGDKIKRVITCTRRKRHKHINVAFRAKITPQHRSE